MKRRQELKDCVLIGVCVAVLGFCLIGTSNFFSKDTTQDALDREDFAAADSKLKTRIEATPNDRELRLLAARTARRAIFPALPLDDDDEVEPPTSVGSRQRAEEHLAIFHRLGGARELERFERYLLSAQLGELEFVEGDLMALVRKEIPESPLILEALAKGNLVRYRLREAKVCLDQWLKLRESAGAYLMRGWVQERWREPALAIEDYRRCLAIQPENLDAARRLANLLRTSEAEEALKLYRQVARSRPNEVGTTLGIARCEVSLGWKDEARRALDGLLRSHPNHVAALVERGKLELETPEKAEPWFRQALDYSPNDYEANTALYRCFSLAGKDEEARRQKAKLDDVEADIARLHEVAAKATETPQDADLRFEAGALMVCNGREREGKRCLQTALQEDPKHAAARRLLDTVIHGGNAAELRRKVHAELADYYAAASLPDLAARHQRRSKD
jgi:tetratricopeptide (TPR) repeat protein